MPKTQLPFMFTKCGTCGRAYDSDITAFLSSTGTLGCSICLESSSATSLKFLSDEIRNQPGVVVGERGYETIAKQLIPLGCHFCETAPEFHYVLRCGHRMCKKCTAKNEVLECQFCNTRGLAEPGSYILAFYCHYFHTASQLGEGNWKIVAVSKHLPRISSQFETLKSLYFANAEGKSPAARQQSDPESAGPQEDPPTPAKPESIKVAATEAATTVSGSSSAVWKGVAWIKKSFGLDGTAAQVAEIQVPVQSPTIPEKAEVPSGIATAEMEVACDAKKYFPETSELEQEQNLDAGKSLSESADPENPEALRAVQLTANDKKDTQVLAEDQQPAKFAPNPSPKTGKGILEDSKDSGAKKDDLKATAVEQEPSKLELSASEKGSPIAVIVPSTPLSPNISRNERRQRQKLAEDLADKKHVFPETEKDPTATAPKPSSRVKNSPPETQSRATNSAKISGEAPEETMLKTYEEAKVKTESAPESPNSERLTSTSEGKSEAKTPVSDRHEKTDEVEQNATDVQTMDPSQPSAAHEAEGDKVVRNESDTGADSEATDSGDSSQSSASSEVSESQEVTETLPEASENPVLKVVNQPPLEQAQDSANILITKQQIACEVEEADEASMEALPQISKFRGGAVTTTDTKTKEEAKMKCEKCHREGEAELFFLCKDCEIIVCALCGMLAHKMHVTRQLAIADLDGLDETWANELKQFDESLRKAIAVKQEDTKKAMRLIMSSKEDALDCVARQHTSDKFMEVFARVEEASILFETCCNDHLAVEENFRAQLLTIKAQLDEISREFTAE
ncbi:unnamed protein product, partial [Mesorhabditis spiculigera]